MYLSALAFSGGVARNAKRLGFVVSAATAAALLSGCAGVLDPKGDAASETARLAWIMFLIAAVVFGVVLVILLGGAVRHRGRLDADADPTQRPAGVMTVIGAVVPVVIITAVLLISFGPLSSQASTDDAALTVRVVGHRWWWDVSYPEEGVITANEIHIPTGEKVRVELASADVIHSFWVPELSGKRDLVPGQTNELWLEADRPGRYEGQCAEYCGIAHARMRTVVIADSPAEFEQWLAAQREQAPDPSDAALLAGQQVFLGSSCSYCHRVAGTNATATFGPDLTHVASRSHLAAGIIPNTPGDLGRWISDPQSVKPGTLMPGVQLSSAELSSLIAYLESLQ